MWDCEGASQLPPEVVGVPHGKQQCSGADFQQLYLENTDEVTPGILGGSVIKNMPAKRETWVRSLGWEDPLLEKGMVTHSSILAWKIPQTEEPGRLQSVGSQGVGRD